MDNEPMDGDLSRFLCRYAPKVVEVVTWGESMSLQVTAYVTDAHPPTRYVTSVRCLLFHGSCVLVQRDKTTSHILPGGRCERGESLQNAVRREVLEETGWTLSSLCTLGFLHFHHLGRKPDAYDYPYPDFLQVVYVSEAVRFLPGAKVDDGYELESAFRPVGEVRHYVRTDRERLYLNVGQERLMACRSVLADKPCMCSVG